MSNSNRCQHQWAGYSGGQSCTHCGASRPSLSGVVLFVLIVWAVLTVVLAVLTTGCSSRPVPSETLAQHPQTQPAAGGDDRGDDRLGEDRAERESERPEPKPRPGEAAHDDLPDVPDAEPSWRVRLAERLTALTLALADEGHAVPAGIVHTTWWLSGGGDGSLDEAWEWLRAALRELRTAPESLRARVRDALREVSQRRAREAS